MLLEFAIWTHVYMLVEECTAKVERCLMTLILFFVTLVLVECATDSATINIETILDISMHEAEYI